MGAALLLPSIASADAPRLPRKDKADLYGLKSAALLDGAWALAAQLNSSLTTRAWDAPYPWGTLGHYSARILYGTSWTLMMNAEALVVLAANGGGVDWIAEGSYRSDWVMPVDAPACPHVGAWGGCGLGIGTFSFMQIRPMWSRWWFEAGGGWIQQRILNDADRTVAESSWVLTPLSALRELRTDPSAAIALRVFAGPGIYFGMHAGHMHPTKRGRELFPGPWTQLYPLAAGIGPGARVEARLVLARRVSIEADVVVAPFVLGGPSTASRNVAPLESDRDGVPIWRKWTAGLGWDDPKHLPFKPTLAVFGAELGTGASTPWRGAVLRFDVPLEVRRAR